MLALALPMIVMLGASWTIVVSSNEFATFMARGVLWIDGTVIVVAGVVLFVFVGITMRRPMLVLGRRGLRFRSIFVNWDLVQNVVGRRVRGRDYIAVKLCNSEVLLRTLPALESLFYGLQLSRERGDLLVPMAAKASLREVLDLIQRYRSEWETDRGADEKPSNSVNVRKRHDGIVVAVGGPKPFAVVGDAAWLKRKRLQRFDR